MANGNGGGRGPWGQGPSGGGQGGPGGGDVGPDLEDLLRRGQERFRRARRNGGGPGGGGFGSFGAGGLIVIALVALLGWASTGIMIVAPAEEGVVTRFGAYDRTHGPGFNLHWPWPIEAHYKPDVAQVRQVDIGFVDLGNDRKRDIATDSLMLTGDGNIVDVDYSVLWYINDSRNYLFNIQNQDGTVRVVAESAMREVAGQASLEQMRQERERIAAEVRDITQRVLDEYAAGVTIQEVIMRESDPPPEVLDAFRDVEAAQQDRERLRNEAEAYANQIVPRAQGEADQIIQEAEGYRERTVAEADGEAQRFLAVLEQYRNAPEVTRERLYFESMEEVLGQTDMIIVDESAAGGVVPYLPLSELERSGSSNRREDRGGQ